MTLSGILQVGVVAASNLPQMSHSSCMLQLLQEHGINHAVLQHLLSSTGAVIPTV